MDVVAAAARYDAHVWLTTRTAPSVRAAIAGIPQTAWTAIHYPDAFVDTETGELISDAEVAETGYTALTPRPKETAGDRPADRAAGQAPQPQAAAGQDELFTLWRHHAVFVTSGFQTLQAESQHRQHAIIEQTIADAAASALAHLPSGVFTANAAWTVLWAITHNLTRAVGVLAGTFHARATTSTIRAHLINVPARIARSARRVSLHMPQTWRWEPAWTALHNAVHRPTPRSA